MSDALKFHKNGMVEIKNKVTLKSDDDIFFAYLNGVHEPCTQIFNDEDMVIKYTNKKNNVLLISDGSRIAGMGEIGPKAAIPVLEGKSTILKEFAGLDAFPIAINDESAEELTETIAQISHNFSAINIEGIKSEKIFKLLELLNDRLDLPVYNDETDGFPIVVAAALKNALKIRGLDLEKAKILITGAGPIGYAITKLLTEIGAKNIIVSDTHGAIHQERKGLNQLKKEISEMTNPSQTEGKLKDLVIGVQVFIGVSSPGILTTEMVEKMDNPIIFALSSPMPEITKEHAQEGKALMTFTSDDGMINPVIITPGIIKGIMEINSKLTDNAKIDAVNTLAGMIKPTKEKLIPGIFTKDLQKDIANAVKKSLGFKIKQEKI